MNERIDQIIPGLQKSADEARAAFGNLSREQLNWKPSTESWSVAQCLDHLITTHSLYFPLFKRVAGGGMKPTLWERFSPLSGFFGRFLIRTLDPANQKKLKTTSKAYPSASEIDGDIVETFCQHQAELIGHLRNLPHGLDVGRTIVTSPLLALVTYSLDDTFAIIDVHCKRHLGQANRVLRSEGFPAEAGSANA